MWDQPEIIFCFCTDKQSQKSELQWMNPFMVEPAHGGTSPSNPVLLTLPTSCCAWLSFPKKMSVMPKVGTWITQFAEEWHSQIVLPLFSSPAFPLLWWGFQALCTSGSQRRRRWRREAGKESGEGWELPSWKLGSWKLVWSSLVFKRIQFLCPFSTLSPFNRTKVLP